MYNLNNEVVNKELNLSDYLKEVDNLFLEIKKDNLINSDQV